MLILVLALSALFFGWRSYEAWTRPMAVAIHPSSGTGVAPIGVSTSDSPNVSSDISAHVASIGARPVFRPDRKPYSEGGAAFPQRNYDAELSRFTLLGVLQMAGDKKGIVVGKGSGARDERWEVGPGDTLPGFHVKDIGVEGMTLTADGREFLLPLYAGGPKGAAGQAAARTGTIPQPTQASKPQPAPAVQGRKPSPAAQSVPPAPPPAAGAPPAPMVPPPDYTGRRRVRPFLQQERPAIPGGR
jgi:hypothetical protein